MAKRKPLTDAKIAAMVKDAGDLISNCKRTGPGPTRLWQMRVARHVFRLAEELLLRDDLGRLLTEAGREEIP